MPDPYTDTSVKWIDSAMRGTPTLSGTAGAMLDVLDAFLITGWGLTSALSVTVADGIATATLTPGETFVKHSVVLIAGATPAALNGDARVLSSTNNAITWVTTAPDGPATGTITIKYAPQGQWEKVYSAANVAVYRSTDVTGARFYYRIDDSNAQFALLVGYESMSDVDTGEGRFPTVAQVSAGVRLLKSTTSNSTARGYVAAADSKTVIIGAQGWGNTAACLKGFGEAIPLNPAGDAYGSFVQGNSATGYYGISLDSTGSANGEYGLTYTARDASGLGSSASAGVFSYVGKDFSTYVSGADDYLGSFTSSLGGRLKLSRRFISNQWSGTNAQALTAVPRVEVPGVFRIPQSGLLSVFGRGDLIDIGGRICFAVHSTVAGTATGVSLLDITGPWR